MSQRVGLLSIGTELTSGEVTNSNAAWLAERLTSLGFNQQCHLAVSDDSKEIQAALDFLAKSSSLILVSGGLGPTSDDLTREELANWTKVPLELREDVWRALQSLCQQRGMSIRDGHKRQCFFPRGAQLLDNPVGTAKGFFLEAANTKILALPGPPREIKGMWQESLLPVLNELVQENDVKLYRWTCLNVAESEVAEVVEKVLAGEGLKIGYRANIPYVQVKVWSRPGAENEPWYERLSQAIEHWTIQSERDPAEELLAKFFQLKKVCVYDALSKGRLTSRFEEVKEKTDQLGPQELKIVTHLYGDQFDPLPDGEWTQLRLLPGECDQSYTVKVEYNSQSLSRDFKLPYRLKHSSKRGRFYVTEQAIYAWLQFLTNTEQP